MKHLFVFVKINPPTPFLGGQEYNDFLYGELHIIFKPRIVKIYEHLSF